MDLLRTRANLEGKTTMELACDLQRYKISNLIDHKLAYEVVLLTNQLKAKKQNDLKIKELTKKPVKLLLKKNRVNSTVYNKEIK